jgi:hypothetical protein
MTLHTVQKMLTAEERMMRIMMPMTSANDPEPLTIYVNKPTAVKVFAFKLGDICRASK